MALFDRAGLARLRSPTSTITAYALGLAASLSLAPLACGRVTRNAPETEDGPPAWGLGGAAPDNREGSDGHPDIEQRYSKTEACADYIKARCDRVVECGDTLVPPLHCNVDTLCPDILFSEGSTHTVESAYACASEWRSISCESLSAFRVPECEYRAGTKQDGELCTFSSQCVGRCPEGSPWHCGECAPAEEPFCGNEVCPPLHGCLVSSIQENHCLPLVPHPSDVPPVPQLGQPCTSECEPGTFCGVRGEATERTCLALDSEVGSTCLQSSPMGGSYRCGGDLGCRDEDKTCQTRPGEAEPCLVEATPHRRGCRQGLVCVASDPELAPGSEAIQETGTCQAFGGPGSRCLTTTDYLECDSDEVCREDVCIRRIPLREKGCEAEFTECEWGGTCVDDTCVPDDSVSVFEEVCTL